MRVMILMVNQDLSVMWKILNILNILVRTIYLVLPPLVMGIMILITKVMNMLRSMVQVKSLFIPSSAYCYSIIASWKYECLSAQI